MMMMRFVVVVVQQVLLFVLIISQCNIIQKVSSLSVVPPTQSTIAVCVGPDCLVDGSTGSLKSIQSEVSKLKKKKKTKEGDFPIKVVSRQCLGPCGDGPCALILDRNEQRVVKDQPSETTGQGSLVPAELFGSNPTGVYQVRTKQNVDFVIQLAAETAGISSREELVNDNDDGSEVVTSSSRLWYDRPRNERKVLQRFAQFMVLAGLYDYSKSHVEGGIGETQWFVAGILFLASLGITAGKS